MTVSGLRIQRTLLVLAGLVLLHASVARAASALKRGEDLYQQGEYQLALERLQKARAESPDDAEAALFLGLTYLRLDDPQNAAAHWRAYVGLAKDARAAGDVKRFTTILLREANARAAKQAVEEERRRQAASTEAKTIAVATFRNRGQAELAPLAKALAAILVDDLAALSDVDVLERERVQALLDEARLGAVADPAAAVRSGKLLGAGKVVAGSYLDWTASPAHLRIQSLLVDVDSGGEIATSSAEGKLAEFYDVVPRVAAALAAALGQPVTKLPASQAERVRSAHTKSLAALLAFGRGLDRKDAGDYPAAKAEFELSLREDESFDLPRRELDALPATLISLVAVGNSVEEIALAKAASTSGLSFTSKALIGAGVVAAGGVIAAVAASGGGGGGRAGPSISGVSDRTAAPGDTVVIDLTARESKPTKITLSAQNLPPGATFQQTSGNPASGRFQWTPRSQDQGVHAVTFTATDDASPPASSSATSRITVAAGTGATPTMPPSATSTPTPSTSAAPTDTPTPTPTSTPRG